MYRKAKEAADEANVIASDANYIALKTKEGAEEAIVIAKEANDIAPVTSTQRVVTDHVVGVALPPPS